jgi:hypothetical protein
MVGVVVVCDLGFHLLLAQALAMLANITDPTIMANVINTPG